MSIDSPRVSTPPQQTSRRSQSAVWMPWLVVAFLATTITLTFILTDNSTTVVEPPYPSHQLDNSVVPWVFAYAWPALWLSLLILIVVRTVRARTFSMPALLLPLMRS